MRSSLWESSTEHRIYTIEGHTRELCIMNNPFNLHPPQTLSRRYRQPATTTTTIRIYAATCALRLHQWAARKSCARTRLAELLTATLVIYCYYKSWRAKLRRDVHFAVILLQNSCQCVSITIILRVMWYAVVLFIPCISGKNVMQIVGWHELILLQHSLRKYRITNTVTLFSQLCVLHLRCTECTESLVHIDRHWLFCFVNKIFWTKTK